MAKRESFSVQGLRIETWRDGDNGRVYCCWKPHVSVFCGSRKAVLQFAAWPIKTPSGDALRVWLTEMEGKDTPAIEKPADAQVEGSFDPLAHEEDPALSTKMVL